MAKFDPTKALKTLTIGHGSILVPHINAYQSAGKFPPEWHIVIDNRDRVEDDFFHPSTDALATPLELYKRKKGIGMREKITASQRRTLDIGHAWHRYLQNILIEMGVVAPENVEREYEKRIVNHRGYAKAKGTLDLVNVEIPGHGIWPVVDIKTVNKPMFERGFDARTMAKYEAQVNCYLDWVGGDKAMILAVCKDSPHDLREYIIQRNKSLVDEIYDRWVYTAQCLRTDTMPDE